MQTMSMMKTITIRVFHTAADKTGRTRLAWGRVQGGGEDESFGDVFVHSFDVLGKGCDWSGCGAAPMIEGTVKETERAGRYRLTAGKVIRDPSSASKAEAEPIAEKVKTLERTIDEVRQFNATCHAEWAKSAKILLTTTSKYEELTAQLVERCLELEENCLTSFEKMKKGFAALRRDLDVVMGTKAEDKKVDKDSQEKTTKPLHATKKGFDGVAEKIAKDFCGGDKKCPNSGTLPSNSSMTTKTSIFDDVSKPNIFNTQTKPPMLFNRADPPTATSKKDGAARKSGVLDTKMQTLLDISPALVPFAEETFGSSTLVDPGPWREKFVTGGGG